MTQTAAWKTPDNIKLSTHPRIAEILRMQGHDLPDDLADIGQELIDRDIPVGTPISLPPGMPMLGILTDDTQTHRLVLALAYEKAGPEHLRTMIIATEQSREEVDKLILGGTPYVVGKLGGPVLLSGKYLGTAIDGRVIGFNKTGTTPVVGRAIDFNKIATTEENKLSG